MPIQAEEPTCYQEENPPHGLSSPALPTRVLLRVELSEAGLVRSNKQETTVGLRSPGVS